MLSTTGSRRTPLAVLAVASAVLLALGACSRASSAPTPANLSADQGVDAATINIGASMPLTGPIAGAGQALSNGLKIAVGTVNETGGVHGRKINATIYDDQYSTPTQVANIQKLVSEDKVYALVDLVGTQLIPASWTYLGSSGIPVWGPISPTDPHMSNVFLLGAAIRDQAAVEMDYLIAKGFKKIGIIYLQGAFGDAEKVGITAVLAKHPDVTIVSEQSMAVTDLNPAPYVINAQKANPEAFILGCSNTQSYVILKQAANSAFKPFFIGNGNTVTTPQISTLASDEGLVSTAITQALNSPNPAVVKFNAEAAKYTPGIAPTLQTLQAYANAMVFFHTLQSAGDNLSWKNFIKTAESTKNYDSGIYPPITLGPLPNGHSGASGSLVTVLKSGTFTPETGKFIEPSA